MKWKVPIGIEDFEEMREDGYYFVDKTGFLSDFLDDHAKVTLLTRPRRFGKTLLLSIMQHFFDIKDAEKNRKFFGGLKVAEDARAMAEQGKRPVIFLTLKDWEAGSWELMQDYIAIGLQDVCRSLMYLLTQTSQVLSTRKAL